MRDSPDLASRVGIGALIVVAPIDFVRAGAIIDTAMHGAAPSKRRPLLCLWADADFEVWASLSSHDCRDASSCELAVEVDLRGVPGWTPMSPQSFVCPRRLYGAASGVARTVAGRVLARLSPRKIPEAARTRVEWMLLQLRDRTIRTCP